MGGGISIDGSGSPFPGRVVGGLTGGLALGATGPDEALGSGEADAGAALDVAMGAEASGDVVGAADGFASGDGDGSVAGRPQLAISVPIANAATTTASATTTKPTQRRPEIAFTAAPV